MTQNRRSEDTVELTLRLPRAHVDFARAYAHAHGTTVTAVIGDWLRKLRTEASREDEVLNPRVAEIAGFVHSGTDLDAAYADWFERRHR